MATISDAEFESLSGILNDPEKASNLSIAQLREVRGLLQDFQADRQARRTRFEEEGFSPEQISRLDASFATAPPTAEAQGLEGGALAAERGERNLQATGEGVLRAGEGVLDLAKDIEVGMHLDSPESRAEWKQSVTERRVQASIDHIEEFGQLPGKGWEFAGQVAPWIASIPAAATRWSNMMLMRTVQGGAMGASVFKADQESSFIDRKWDALIGGTLQAAGGLFAVPSQLKASVVRGFVRSFNRGDIKTNEAIEASVRKMADDPEFALSLAQVTGSRTIFGLELSAASQATKDAQNKNIGILTKNLLDTAKSLSDKGMSAGQVAKSLRETMKDARKKIYDSAATDFAAGTKALKETYGDEVVIRGRNYLQKVDKLVEESEDALVSVGGTASKNLKRYRAEVDSIVNPVKVVEEEIEGGVLQYRLLDRQVGGAPLTPSRRAPLVETFSSRGQAEAAALRANETRGISPDQTLRILRGLNQLVGGDVALFAKMSPSSNRNTGRALMGAFFEELDDQAVSPAAADAITGLRNAYKGQMARAQIIDDSVVSAAFGGKRLPRNPGKRLDAVLKSEEEELIVLRDFLDEWNPSLLDDLRATHLTRIVRGGERSLQAGVDTPVDIQKLAKNLADGFGRGGQAGAGLHTAATQADMLLTSKALNTLYNKWFRGITPGGIRPEEVSINVISRAPEFMARFLTRAFTGGRTVERAMLSPAFRKSIQELATKGPKDRVGKAVMVALAEFILDEEVKRNNQRAAQERNEAAARNRASGAGRQF